jgi:ABC-type bacteriocin/lantibiotic exporter with double-glycine peptidase domain
MKLIVLHFLLLSATLTFINCNCEKNTSTKNKQKQLAFIMQKQDGNMLCWAAVASSISKFYDKNSRHEQCTLVNHFYDRTTCCTDLHNCNIAGELELALRYTGNLNSFVKQSPSFDLIKEQIYNHHPVCLRIDMGGIEYHVVVVYGFHADGTVDVEDPWPDRGPVTIKFKELENYYRAVGKIVGYYTTKPLF